jgi:hypothetical protein
VDSRERTALDMKKTIELGLFTRNCHPLNPQSESRYPSPEQPSPSASPKLTASRLPSASRVWSSGGGGQAVPVAVEVHLAHLTGAQSAGHLVGKPGRAQRRIWQRWWQVCYSRRQHMALPHSGSSKARLGLMFLCSCDVSAC